MHGKLMFLLTYPPWKRHSTTPLSANSTTNNFKTTSPWQVLGTKSLPGNVSLQMEDLVQTCQKLLSSKVTEITIGCSQLVSSAWEEGDEADRGKFATVLGKLAAQAATLRVQVEKLAPEMMKSVNADLAMAEHGAIKLPAQFATLPSEAAQVSNVRDLISTVVSLRKLVAECENPGQKLQSALSASVELVNKFFLSMACDCAKVVAEVGWKELCNFEHHPQDVKLNTDAVEAKLMEIGCELTVLKDV